MAKTRFTMDMNDDVRAKLDTLCKRGNHETIAGLCRNAWSAYEILLDYYQDGGRIILEDKKGRQRELELLAPKFRPK